ncbi:MAG: choice-of-anchor Q domain-containing protein [Bacteroidia bacterium]
MKLYTFLFFLLACFFLSINSSCDKPVITVEKGPLSFSEDTLKFDTVFTTLRAPTERLMIRNKTNNNIKIKRIWLESGAATEFNLIVDGIVKDDVGEIILPAKDSIHIFVTLKSQQKDQLVIEKLKFQTGDDIQTVYLQAKVLDAYFFQVIYRNDSVFYPYVCHNVLDTTFTNNKPIVIDGPLFVPKGRKLRIEAGTKLFFTSRKDYYKNEATGAEGFAFISMLIVDGTLEIVGNPAQKVTMEGSRLHTDTLPYLNYSENSGQWRGVYFSQSSDKNSIEHLVLKNAEFGLLVDSMSPAATSPKLTVKYSKIRNMSAYGLGYLGRNGAVASVPAVVMENSLINDCSLYPVVLDNGGWCEFYNCTFSNAITAKEPTFWVNNYDSDGFGNLLAGPFFTKTKLVNCAIWGNDEHECSIDILAQGNEINLENCLVKIDTENHNDYIAKYFTNVLINENPQFNNTSKKDYRPKENSPLRDKGTSNPLPYTFDIRGRADSARTVPYDIGAYEYFKID